MADVTVTIPARLVVTNDGAAIGTWTGPQVTSPVPIVASMTFAAADRAGAFNAPASTTGGT